MKLSDWIESVGGRPAAAALIGVTPEAIHYWMAKKSTPNFHTMFKIGELSKNKVTPGQMLEETGFYERMRVKKDESK